MRENEKLPHHFHTFSIPLKFQEDNAFKKYESRSQDSKKAPINFHFPLVVMNFHCIFPAAKREVEMNFHSHKCIKENLGEMFYGVESLKSSK